VIDVVFDSNPKTQTFKTEQGEIVSIADYFAKTYGKKITVLAQPLFLVKIA
jgi:hypothetical protein